MPTASRLSPGDERLWKRARIAFNSALLIDFMVLAFHFGPPYVLFGQWTWITPDYFTNTAQTHVEPVVRAIKQYQSDFGILPPWGQPLKETLSPKYLPLPSARSKYATWLCENGVVEHWAKWNHLVRYDLTPEREGWSVRGALVSGPIHLPLVTLDPNDRRVARPATGANDGGPVPNGAAR